jgi:hypothetical protein
VQIVSTLDAELIGRTVVKLPINEKVTCVDEMSTPRAVLVVTIEAANVVEKGRAEVTFAAVGN